jgi:hypothetical protein
MFFEKSREEHPCLIFVEDPTNNSAGWYADAEIC